MKRRQLAGFTLLLCSFVFLSGIALGQSVTSKKDFAEISNQGTSVAWGINAPNKSVTLRVSAPNGEVYSRDFPTGSTPVFSIPSRTDSFDTNGVYKFEITVNPIISKTAQNAINKALRDGSDGDMEADLRKQGMIPQHLSQSGAFRVVDGQIVTSNDGLVEPTEGNETPRERSGTKTESSGTSKASDSDVPTDNTVITDDLFVLGSTCTGFDCVNGESFGFDTLRLKENNLRINFQDTSNSASFPTNDWRIVANDTTNGGASYLAFEDTDGGGQPFRVEAGAGANALVVDSTGRIGLGTLNPVVEMHIVDGDTPTMRLEQDGSSGFGPQTWDVAGNESNFFVRDVSNGSTLPFRIQPGASNGSLNIGTSGNVGIGFGTNNFSTNPLEVRNNNSTQLAIVNTSGELHLPLTGGGVRFPDGSLQQTAATGGGFGETNTGSNVGTGSTVFKQKVGVDFQFKSFKAGPNITVSQTADEITIGSSTGNGTSQHILGGGGHIASFSTIPTPTVDYNTFSVGTAGATGFFTTTHQIPYNLNLSDPTATQIVVKIRYRDTDGMGTASRVIVELVGIDVTTGGQARNIVFDSNTDGSTGFTTVTKCIATPSSLFSANVRGMHANISVSGTAAQSADFAQMQVYKSNTCP